MADNNGIMDLVKVAVDAYRGNVAKYSVGESMDMLRAAAIELNGGSTKLDYKAIRDGKCSGLFTLIEEMISRVVVEDLTGDEYFNKLVEFRNIGLGDQNLFEIEDAALFSVDEIADGTQALRRQRLSGKSTFSIATKRHGVKIYEELNRVLAGQVDFNQMIAKVAESYRRALLQEIYALWSNATAADLGDDPLDPVYTGAGTYDADTLLGIIEHVEAAAGGKPVTIIGTKAALRKLAPDIQGADSRSDIYNMGYYGNFYGSSVLALPQRHKIGTVDFVHDDNVLNLVASDEKPIKCVYEGQPLIIPGEIYKNQDLTQDYLYSDKHGMQLVLPNGNSGFGRFTFTAGQ